VRRIVLVLVVVLVLDRGAAAATIRAVGVLGNSGVAGEGLLRVGGEPIEHCASGVALDGDWTLWLSGGDRINRVGLDGHLVESFPLAPAATMVDSRTFGVLDATLYFLARDAKGQIALFRLPMRSQATVSRVPGSLPERKRGHVGYCLAPQPLGQRLVLALEPKESAEDAIGACLLDPATGECRQAFALKGSSPAGVAVDSRREVIYVGGNFGLFVGGETHSSVCAITAVRPDGKKVSDAFPAACPKTPATPTQFRGVLSLAGGALWDTAWYGFLARLDLEGRGDPGRIVEWHHELDYPTQVLGVLDQERGAETPRLQPLVIATPIPDAFHFAVWDRAGQTLRFVRRIGCLPTIASLGLSEEGWVTVGTARSQLWWRWEDPADAPARKAELHIAVTPLFVSGGQALGLAAQYRLASYRGKAPVPTVFHPRVGERNEARRVEGALPVKRPVGLAVRIEPGKQSGTLFVTDAETKRLWATDVWLSNLQPNKDKWRAVAIEGGALAAPTDVAALADGRLLVADEGRVLLLEPQGEAFRIAWQLGQWGQGERFGKRLRLAADGPWMLVSDTERHRVLWFDWAQRKAIGQLGTTDAAGSGAAQLDAPAFVALRGHRAVAADAGNQRVLKIELSP